MLVATGLNALAAIVPQLVALVTLEAISYGRFSMVYLVHALGTSMVFSVICDAWSRTSKRRDEKAWRHYSSSLAVFSLPFALAALVIGIAVGVGLPSAASGAVAAAALVYRTGSRYFETYVGDWRHVILGDVANIVFAIAAFVLGWWAGLEPLQVAFLTWMAGAVAAVLASRTPQLSARRPFRRWLVVHRRAIRPLLADSMLMDLGAIGTPYAIAPVLGLAQFGVYRAVSNLATPVQLVLNPLRPLVTSSSQHRLLSARLMVPLTVLLVLAGLAGYWVIMLLPGLPFRLGVLSELYQVAAPAALFIPANGLSFYVYLVARGHAPTSRIFPARVVQTTLAVLAPVLGAVGWGLTGAVWGFSGSALSFAAVWWLALTLPRRSRSVATS